MSEQNPPMNADQIAEGIVTKHFDGEWLSGRYAIADALRAAFDAGASTLTRVESERDSLRKAVLKCIVPLKALQIAYKDRLSPDTDMAIDQALSESLFALALHPPASEEKKHG